MIEWDIPNWVALVIELGIGIPIAIFLSVFFYRRQKKISAELEKIVKEQESFRNRRYSWAINGLKSNFSILIYYLKEIEILQDAFNGIPENDRSIETRIWGHVQQLTYFVNELENLINQSIDVVDPAITKESRDICEYVKHFSKRENVTSIKPSKTGTLSNIDNFLKKLPNITL